MKYIGLQCTIIILFASCSLRTAENIQQSVTENGGYSLKYEKNNSDKAQLKIDLVSLGRYLAPDSSYIRIRDEEKIYIGDKTFRQELNASGFLFVEASSLGKVKEETRLIEIRNGYDIHIVFYLINKNAVFTHSEGR